MNRSALMSETSLLFASPISAASYWYSRLPKLYI